MRISFNSEALAEAEEATICIEIMAAHCLPVRFRRNCGVSPNWQPNNPASAFPDSTERFGCISNVSRTH